MDHRARINTHRSLTQHNTVREGEGPHKSVGGGEAHDALAEPLTASRQPPEARHCDQGAFLPPEALYAAERERQERVKRAKQRGGLPEGQALPHPLPRVVPLPCSSSRRRHARIESLDSRDCSSIKEFFSRCRCRRVFPERSQCQVTVPRVTGAGGSVLSGGVRGALGPCGVSGGEGGRWPQQARV
ncbi:hypothetical protein O3P69_020252 [Scylla paramamosain]|uniref:Uncharacterized protein n=1 Tax=Scylla paramamosain TaxID=85552 RepID=A0AAW0TMB3_SCYPA